MAVDIEFKFNNAVFAKELLLHGEKWAKEMDYAVRDMRRAAPPIVAGIAAQRYNIKKGELNANSKNFQGGCRLSGGISDLTLTYSGRRLTATHFNMNPTANPGVGKVYKLKATFIRGNRVEIGHWRKPGTEGGAYGGTSPYMLLPGKKPPLQRIGGGWGGAGAKYKPFRTLSVPQMVTYSGNRDEVTDKLQKRASEILMNRLQGLGLRRV